MAVTWNNGDTTTITVPQAFADLSGSVAGNQMPGGTPTGTGAVVMASGPTLVAPVLGTPASGNLANCTFPTLNQNTSGSSASCTGNAATATKISTNGTANQVWSMDSGGTVQVGMLLAAVVEVRAALTLRFNIIALEHLVEFPG